MPHPDMSSSWVNGHPDEGLLHEWLDAQLSVENATEIEAHVAGCAECGALVAEARGLIAASHRILSALDDVPANVIPLAPQSVGSADGLAEIAIARKAQEARRLSQQRTHTSLRWRGIGKVAALLLIVLVPGVMLLRGDDVAAPVAFTTLQAADSNLGVPSPTADVPAMLPAVDPAAAMAPTSAERSAKTAANAMADVSPRAETRGAATVPASDAAKTSAPVQPGSARERRQVAFAEAERAPAPRPTTTFPAASPQPAAPATTSAAEPVIQLQSRVAGVRGGVARGGEGTQTLTNTPVPPPASSVAGGFAANASPARTDSVNISRDVASAAKRLASGDSSTRARPQVLGLSALATDSRAAFASRTTFDSVTLTRTLCRTACETAVLHLSSLGAVRYGVSSGSTTMPTVTAQISAGARARIGELLAGSIAESVGLQGQLRCTVSRGTGSTVLEVLIANGAGTGARSETRCTTTDAALVRLGASIDSIIGTEALRRRIP